MGKILGIGNALVDILVQVPNDHILEELSLPKGSMQLLDVKRYHQVQQCFANLVKRQTTGGSACNTVLAIAHLGEETGLIGKIGNDDVGNFFKQEFYSQDVSLKILTHSELPTGIASTIITPDGQRTFGTYLGAAATLSAEDIQNEWFEGYEYLYIEGYLVQNHDLILHAVKVAHEKGLKVCLDLASYNIVQAERDFFAQLLPLIDIVFANEQEVASFTGVTDIKRNLELLSLLCNLVIIKVGKKGVWVRKGEESVHCPARNVPYVVDTTAAGDYFSAGFLFAHAIGRNLMECAELGSFLAGHIIEVVGTALPSDTWQKIKETL